MKQNKRNKQNKKKGQKFENKVSRTINSGSLWFSKGDLVYQDYCIECKVTDKKGFRISTKLLEKLWQEALNSNKEPLLIVGIPRNEDEMFMVRAFIEIKQK